MRCKVLISLCLLSGCSTTDHKIYMQNVSNYARNIEPSNDFIVLKDWLGVLDRQPIIEGKGKPSYEVMKAINDIANNKPYKKSGWLTPKEFNSQEYSDCKGYTIAKYYELRRAGWKASELNIWTGDYLGRSHLVLVASLEGKQYVLDIGYEGDLPEAKEYFYKRFFPAYRFNENGWDVN